MSKFKPRNVPPRRPGPVGGKRDENRRKRTEQLCQAGLKIFLERGVEVVTIDEIVGEAGMAKGSFYRYFKDKTDLVEAIFVPMREVVTGAFDGCAEALAAADSRETLFAAYEGLAARLGAFVLSHPNVVRLYLQESRGPGVGARAPIRELGDLVSERAVDITQVAREHGLLRPVKPRISALSVIGAVERLTFGFLNGEDLGEAHEIPDQLISLVLDGLRDEP